MHIQPLHLLPKYQLGLIGWGYCFWRNFGTIVKANLFPEPDWEIATHLIKVQCQPVCWKSCLNENVGVWLDLLFAWQWCCRPWRFLFFCVFKKKKLLLEAKAEYQIRLSEPLERPRTLLRVVNASLQKSITPWAFPSWALDHSSPPLPSNEEEDLVHSALCHAVNWSRLAMEINFVHRCFDLEMDAYLNHKPCVLYCWSARKLQSLTSHTLFAIKSSDPWAIHNRFEGNNVGP